MKHAWIFALAGAACLAAPPEPPCGLRYGTPEDQKAIERAMLRGSAAEVTAAIRKAIATRGAMAGCAETEYSASLMKPGFDRPSFETVAGKWKENHLPRLSGHRADCPEAGRFAAAAALGAWYAAAGGVPAPAESIARIVRMQEAQQYTRRRAPGEPVFPEGVFGYARIPGGDRCASKSGVIQRGVEKLCATLPFACKEYTEGLFKGLRFPVADVIPDRGFIDGGFAYDHAFAGVLMVETAARHPDAEVRKLAAGSARLAGEWAIGEPVVRNHNYTSKLVWLLARLYGWTGDSRYRDAMLDKLERNLKPGVLMDQDGDGKVDGVPEIRFANLAEVARRPGRMWDAHNALPWYGAMNAWAFVEAYAALRDRGDRAAARAVRPYAIAMVDNLAWEVNHLGPGPAKTAAAYNIPLPLLLGLMKIAGPEKDAKPEWERAAWAVWNTGIADEFGLNTIDAGLYVQYASGK